MKNTKIVATHGPAVHWEEDLLNLYDAGVNIIRFNFSHAKYGSVQKVLEIMRKNNRNGRAALSMMLDTKGPEIRTGDLGNKQEYRTGDIFRFYTNKEAFWEDGSSLFCDYPHLGEDAFLWQVIDVDSGLFQIKVISLEKDYLEVEAQNDALIWSRRHVNLPGIRLKMPGITEKDREDIQFAVEESMDFIAQSFVRSWENVRELREYLEELWGYDIKIIAKIENQEWLENMTDIIRESDGVMVARWDLGIEVPIEKLPTIQSNMVRDTLAAGKFTIIATHMLESMIENPFPTRAEVSDIYNAVMQRSDAVMLSGETAAWKYPLKSVQVMAATVREAEVNLTSKDRDFSNDGLSSRDIEKKSLIKSAIRSGEELGVQWLFIFTKSGKLARLASGFRSSLPIYAFTMNLQSVAYMNILYGVTPFLLPEWDEKFIENIYTAIDVCKEYEILKKGDKIMIVNDIQKNKKEIPVVELMEIT